MFVVLASSLSVLSLGRRRLYCSLKLLCTMETIGRRLRSMFVTGRTDKDSVSQFAKDSDSEEEALIRSRALLTLSLKEESKTDQVDASF